MENSLLPSNRILSVCIEPTGVKWFGTDAGLARFDGAEWSIFTKTTDTQTLADNIIHDIAFEISSSGPEIWIGTENGLSILAVDDFTFATPYRSDNRPLLSNQIRAVEVDSNHIKWIATDSGVSIFDGSRWASLTKENDMLITNDITCIGIDNDGDSLWRYIGTADTGVTRINYFSDELEAALADTNQNPLDAITSASPYTAEWTRMRTDSITAIEVIHPQQHWIGTTHGLYQHDSTATKERWLTYRLEQGLVDTSITSLATGSDGSIWVGTLSGVSKITNSIIKNYTVSDGLINGDVNDLAVDTDGSLWIATEGGLSHLQHFSIINTPRKIPRQYQLIANYPNPFNSATVIFYYLTSVCRIRLTIYDLTGREIRQLQHEIQPPDYYRITWDGKDQMGRPVPAGIYFTQLNIDNSQHTETLKMLLIK
jgi:ligand-binding sensor domain-containing protein